MFLRTIDPTFSKFPRSSEMCAKIRVSTLGTLKINEFALKGGERLT